MLVRRPLQDSSMSAAQSFINYRRDDTAAYALAVYDALARRFGPQQVFIEVDDIAAGQPFDAAKPTADPLPAPLRPLARRRPVGIVLHCVPQTDGGYSAHRPMAFVARRSPP